MAEKSVEMVDGLRKRFAGHLSEQDIEFLRDVQGFIDFAIRNGLSFPMIAASVGQDFNGLSREGFDLAAAKAAGFSPNVAGYGKVTSEDVGDSEHSAA